MIEKIKKLFIYFIFILFFISVVNAYTPENNLVVYYPFDNNANDNSGNSRDATASGVTFNGTNAIFTGTTQYIDLPDLTGEIDYLQETLNFWVWGNNADTAIEYLFVDKGNPDAFIGFFYDNTPTDTFRPRIKTGSSFNSLSPRNNSWNMISVVMGTTNYEVYINGVSTGTGTIGSGTGNEEIRLGLSAGGTFSFNGYMRDFSYFNTTLNSSNIEDIYLNGIILSSTPQIQTNLTSFVNQGTFTSTATTTSNVNMSLYINGTLNTSICDNCNSSTFNLSLPLGFTTVGLRSENVDGINWNNITVEYDSNHYFRFYDLDNSSYVQNYTFGGVSSSGDYVIFNTSELLPYGSTISKLFSGAGYLEQNFTFSLDNLNEQLNLTFNVSEALINIFLKRVDNGSDAPNQNYTVILTNQDNGQVNTYNIVNDNNLTLQNNYANQTNILLSVIQNSSVTSSQEIITPRKNLNITLFLPFEETEEQRVIEVLTGTLLPIANNDVYLYRFIEGEGFVLQTIKETNVLGQVVFNVVPLSAIYNICSIYEGTEKCLNQVTFENADTDDFQIVHDINFNPITRNFLQDIEWSNSEVQTNTTIQLTMSFEDSSTLTSSFCYNVTRTNNSLVTNLGDYCNNNYVGQIVNTFGLEGSQYIDVTYYFIREGETFNLATLKFYAEDSNLALFNQASLFDVVFLILYFGLLGILLKMADVNKYNIGVLVFLAFTLSIQAYFNVNYAFAGIWAFIGLKTAVFYGVRITS